MEQQRQHADPQADVTLFLGLTGLRRANFAGCAPCTPIHGHLIGTDAERAATERINGAFGHRSGTSPGQTSGQPLTLEPGQTH